MNLKRHRRRTAVIAAFLMTGAIVVQLGPMCSLAGGTGVAAFNWGSLLDANGRLFGLFNVCGVPDVMYVDANGVPIGSSTQTGVSGTQATVQFTGDDLIYQCPVTTVQSTTTTGTGTGG